jgi:exonuclease VII small subunit
MKQPQYVEGQQAIKNFEEGMKALFKVPKEKVAQAQKKRKKAPSQEKQPKSDKD